MGYTGFIQIGKEYIAHEKLFTELRSNVARVMKWHQAGTNEADVKGSLKRIKTVLLAFNKHPASEEANLIAQAIASLAFSSVETSSVLDQVLRWTEKAELAPRLRGLEFSGKYEVFPIQRNI